MLRGRTRVRDALRRAEALASEGRVRDAIDDLVAVNRSRRDAAVEAELVALRRRACEDAVSSGGGPSAWPPTVGDLFPGEVGIPEIQRDELTSAAMRSGVLRHGCLLVRNLIPPSAVKTLVADIDRAFAAYDDQAAGDRRSGSPWFVPFDPGRRFPEGFAHRAFVRAGGGVLAADSPPALFDLLETFDSIGLRELLTEYLGEPPMLLAGKLTLRRVSPDERPHQDWDPKDAPDWHQDGAFMGQDIRSVNVWVSLSHCGVDAPGLDVVTGRFEEILATGTDGAHFDWSVGHGLVERTGRDVLRPVFAPGDALIFDQMMVHRTAVVEGMTKDRHAIEAWFAAPAAYPDEHIPILY